MSINPTQESLQITQRISTAIENKTFHHHYHVLYDIAMTFNRPITYAEIGCYAGGSACLMLQRPNTKVVTIDLGTPISEEIVKNNVSKLNPHNNEFYYIKGNSQSPETIKKLKSITQKIDILFIDGDHSFNFAINDFFAYENLVKEDGYVIFDDYNDFLHSPEVKPAVDQIVKNLKNYEIIGTLNNVGARPKQMKEGNCFVLKKKKSEKIAIRVVTYQRSDGSTPKYLERTLNSIKNQTFQNYQVFLTGDKYENHKELEELSKIIDPEKLSFENLPEANERKKYQSGSSMLWCAGGVHAINHTINKILSAGLTWTCHLDHDDWWDNNHLEEFHKIISTHDEKIIFMSSLATHTNAEILPRHQSSGKFYPIARNIIHSATCFDWSKIPLRFRDVYEETGKAYPADAAMWTALSDFMLLHGKVGFLTDKVTCHHEEEFH
jgi:predicted O-methyltransferase YrrM